METNNNQNDHQESTNTKQDPRKGEQQESDDNLQIKKVSLQEQFTEATKNNTEI